MELNYAILCQAAVPQHPLLTIVGAGADNFAVPAFPAQIGGALAISFWLDQNEVKKPHTVSVHFIDEDGKPMPGFDIPALQFPGDPNARLDPHLAHANLNGAVNLNAKVETPGRYAVDVRIDGQAMKRIPFHVVSANGQPPNVGPQMPKMM